MTPARSRSLSLGALALASALAVTGCAATPAESAPKKAAATEIDVTHVQGTTEVPVNPKKVITFDMASLDTLDALDVKVAGLPQQNVPEYLSEYAGEEYLNAGTLFEPDYEAVNAAEPDLIIVANRSAAAYEELSKIAPTIDLTLDWEDYLPSFRTNVETLGEIFEKEDEATEALDQIDAKIDDAKELAADAGTGLIIMTNAGEITAYGSGSRFGWLHDELGLATAIDDVEAATHGDPVSAEFILEANPDWLLVLDRDAAIGESGSTAQQVLDNEVIASTTAWQEDQVLYLDSVPFYVVMSGLGAVNQMVDQITVGLK
ncbi:siderophore ABC transporter substrate-binding protein [Mycetocola manganoxydans]|uniref:Siderophore ABC transporter substrate-binding protein n=1 Tax=Mycetocola manganoxydans TaxID=699879 RepID=A0A3L6ZYV4_9MICO|nr:siderophore ABC transporter substrate-binding protein [Mycetocola manganoxydans]RLP73119.1 siderophore ABC transporter substrate-binding protein [Mycetocola manganoxydans]GHD44025.1 iron ABC transporter substrate-binding protein [Mycetocola manganoxydans]